MAKNGAIYQIIVFFCELSLRVDTWLKRKGLFGWVDGVHIPGVQGQQQLAGPQPAVHGQCEQQLAYVNGQPELEVGGRPRQPEQQRRGARYMMLYHFWFNTFEWGKNYCT